MDGRIRWAYEISPEGNVAIETGGLLWAEYDHRHDNATSDDDGFMSAVDKTNLDTMAGSGTVQGVGTGDSPEFAAATIGGVLIDENGVAHGIKYEA